MINICRYNWPLFITAAYIAGPGKENKKSCESSDVLHVLDGD